MERIIDRLDKYIALNSLNDNKVTTDCGLSVGLIGQARKGKSDIGKKSIEKILNKYQDINRVWLLTGEGNMLKSNISQTSHGDNSPNIAGNGITQTMSSAVELDKALEEIAEMRKIIQEQTRNNQEQFDRFMSVIEHLVSK